MENYSIFIIEDDPWYGNILAYHLGLNPDYTISRFETVKDCLSKMTAKPDLITIDLGIPQLNCEELLKKLKEYNPHVAVIILSSGNDLETAVRLLKMGVDDYLVKDEATKDLLWKSILRIRKNQSLKKQAEELKAEPVYKYSFHKTLIGQSESLRQVFTMMEKAVKTNINVSIAGETGTGKELVARAIHDNSDRREKNFVAVNMAAIPRDLVESELFGYEKGAFTGAATRKTGKFEEANGGTLFLDEIAELDITLQSKLLRVLQERELTRLGGHEKVKLDVRLITATHKDLEKEAGEGKFREDLYFRIMGMPICLPPLRERDNDTLLLAKYFADQFTKENRLPPVRLTAAAKEKLQRYHYPGNIRELKAIIDLAVAISENNEITPEDIRFSKVQMKSSTISESKTLREYTCDIIKQHMQKFNDDVNTTARILDIGKSTIYRLLKTGEIA